MESLSFDRAAGYYDRTRNLSPRAADEVTALLAAELRGRGSTLEIGVGTGRIALPLAAAGIDVVGVDLSLEMLRVLATKGSGAVRVPAAVGDATRLPFPDGRFGAGLVCHVLHLVPAWRDALSELVRTVRPEGVLLVDLGGWSGGDWELIEKHFVERAGIDRARPGATDPDEVDREMAAHGARVRLLPDVEDVATLTYGELIDRIEQGLYSFTWSLDDAARIAAAAELRRWAAAELGDLDEPRPKTWTVTWRAYDLPGQQGDRPGSRA